MPPVDISVQDVVSDLIQPLLQRQFLRFASVFLVGFEDGRIQDVVAAVNRGCDAQAQMRNLSAAPDACLERIEERENLGKEFSFASRPRKFLQRGFLVQECGGLSRSSNPEIVTGIYHLTSMPFDIGYPAAL
jgi:hypothetical protein